MPVTHTHSCDSVPCKAKLRHHTQSGDIVVRSRSRLYTRVTAPSAQCRNEKKIQYCTNVYDGPVPLLLQVSYTQCRGKQSQWSSNVASGNSSPDVLLCNTRHLLRNEAARIHRDVRCVSPTGGAELVYRSHLGLDVVPGGFLMSGTRVHHLHAPAW